MTRPPLLTCGVLVTDGAHLLLGHATASPRWDIPKGLADPGETPRDAAIRELREETGLIASPDALADAGIHPYRPGKQLALFVWRRAAMPDPGTLACTSTFTARNGRTLPEFDRFAVVARAAAGPMLGKAMAALLQTLGWLG